MFTRATSRSYTCLKCQYRLALRESARIESQNIAIRVPRRWQTSAASAAIEDEYEKDVSTHIQRDSNQKQNPKPYSSRRWRPKPTANIGGDVLGKPAEILLLPPSKRRRKKSLRDVDEGAEEDVNGQEAPEQTKGKPQLRIHEALAQESKPTSKKDVLQNIEKIRDEATDNATGGSLTEEEWLIYFGELSKGFTRTQLGWYLEENISGLRSESPEGSVQLQGLNRSQAATEIMSKIWGFAHDVSKDLSGHTSGSVNLGRGRRELILGVDKEWRRFAQHVSIEPSATPGWIDIAGPESWVIKARTVFESLKKRACSRTLRLPTIYENALREQDSDGLEARSMLQKLIQKYEVTMTKRSEWTAYAFKLDRIDKFERDLVLAQAKLSAKSRNTSASLFLSSEPVDMASVMPAYKHTLSPQPPEWHRYSLLKGPSNNMTTQGIIDSESEAFQTLIANLRSHFYDKRVSTLDYSFFPASQGMIGSVTTEFSATIGQALHKSQEFDEVAANDLKSKPAFQRNDLIPRIPLLRQFLVKQEVHPSQKDTTDVTNSPLSLTLIPADTRNCPKIEVRAIISESIQALDMKIESVKLIFSSDSAYVALPTTPNDFKLTRLTSVPIFQRGGAVQEHEPYAPLLGQLGSQIRSLDQVATDPKRLHLNKLLDLDLGCLKTATEVEGTTKRGKSSTSTVRYALDKAELLDKRFYRVPGHDKIMMEHTSYWPLKLSSEQETSEILRVVPIEKASTLVSGEQFVNFAKGAVEVVGMLDEFVTEKTREMVSEKEKKGQVQEETEESV